MYSQYNEEEHVISAVMNSGKVEPGRFLDIGAWDPKTFSNTRALYDRGWQGVCIEPSPGPVLNLLREYGDDPCITIIQAAVMPAAGLLSMHISDDAISTSSETEYEKWKNHAKFLGKLVVPAITLEDIAAQFGGFDVINFDAEGISAELFLHAMDLGWQPKCVIVEHDERTTQIMTRASQCHYHIVYANSTNLVLVRR